MTSFLNPEQWGEILDTIAPFISSATERRQVVRTFLPDMLDTGYSGHKALEIFQQSSLGIGTRTFYSIRREILNDVNLTSTLRSLDPSEQINENMLRIASYPLHGKYRYVASFVMENQSTGQTHWGETAIDTDFIGSKQDILDRVMDNLRERYPQANLDFSAINLRRAYINKS